MNAARVNVFAVCVFLNLSVIRPGISFEHTKGPFERKNKNDASSLIKESSRLVYFTAIPPSPGSQTSRQNLATVEEIETKLFPDERPIPYSGRFKFGVCMSENESGVNDCSQFLLEADGCTPPPTMWSRLLKSGMRSVRLVVFDEIAPSYQLSKPIQDVSATCAEIVNKIDWLSARRQWESFGQQNEPSTEANPFTFHVRCKRHRRKSLSSAEGDKVVDMDFFPPDIAREFRHVFAYHLHHQSGWTPEPIRWNAMMEIGIILHYRTCSQDDRISSDVPSILVELPVLVPPKDRRLRDLPRPGFRRVESWAIAKCANIQPDDVVLDPMCGKGTFLVEAACFFPAQHYIGFDISKEQILDAETNIREAEVRDSVRVFLGDCLLLHNVHVSGLDFKEKESVDKILCCPPFGRQYTRNKDLYENAMKEWARILKPVTGRMVLVIDVGNLEVFTQAIRNNGCRIDEARKLRLGKLKAVILIVLKEENKIVNHDVTNTINFVPCFTWEKEDGKQHGNATDRGLWTVLRAHSLQSLEPACQLNAIL